MLIINADDLGRNERATNNTLACFRHMLVTSGSFMVFMADSVRAADVISQAGLDTGLHLNLTLEFDGLGVPAKLRDDQAPIRRYLRRGKWAKTIYRPFFRNKLHYLFRTQYDEYCRLFGKEPTKVDGHHHMHLCMNMILGHIMPRGLWIRRNYTFVRWEKNALNRLYRRLLDAWLTKRYRCPDSFFSIEPMNNARRLAGIVDRAYTSNVELAVHPERSETLDYIMSPEFRTLIAEVPKGNYLMLSRSSCSNQLLRGRS
jgi:predicted glycoside hydrolase/deacetylase ChbG (UPF0249 family)